MPCRRPEVDYGNCPENGVHTTFLLSVGGVVGCVEVEQNLLRSPVFGAFSQVELKESASAIR
jgi:hypothetical protein